MRRRPDTLPVVTQEPPNLPSTSWVLLGLLSFGQELSGYDLKKWADRSLNPFYWSPSYSQIYGELKRLEAVGHVVSSIEPAEGTRGKRVYAITEKGRDAVRHWAREAPVEPPVLKHGPMLRVWLGHLLAPERLREIITQHRDHAEETSRLVSGAELPAGASAGEYPEMALRWSQRYHEIERELAQRMLEDLDELAAHPRPKPVPGAYAKFRK